MIMTKSKYWYITYSDSGPGDVDGFYCPECYRDKVEKADKVLNGLVNIIKPENASKYECDLCKKDYRDE